MKNVFVFFFSLFVGISLLVLYSSYLNHQNKQHVLGSSVIKATKFSLERAPIESIRGKIVSFSGTVNWQSRIATEPAILKPQIQLQQGELLQTGGNGKIAVQFPNVCDINISPDSMLTFIQTLPVNLVIAQDKGTAKYIKTGRVPLSIHSLDLLIAVTSGDVLVSTDQTQSIVTVAVHKGVVTAAFNDAHNNSTLITVYKGKQFIFDNNSKHGEIKSISP